jgi:hypothetical protein
MTGKSVLDEFLSKRKPGKSRAERLRFSYRLTRKEAEELAGLPNSEKLVEDHELWLARHDVDQRSLDSTERLVGIIHSGGRLRAEGPPRREPNPYLRQGRDLRRR